MPAHPKLLITGASGFLGWHLAQRAQTQWEVYGTYATHQPVRSPLTWLGVDLTDFAALKALFDTVQPDAVIHTAAQSKPNLCQENPEAAYAINVTASINIAGLCSDRAIPCVFTSTDLVFDGRQAPYRETDPVNPVNIYGEQKVLAESGMLARYPQTAICRMPLMFGVAPTAPSFLQPFLHQLQAGTPLDLFVDEFRTPASGPTAAEGLLLALEHRVQGRLHLGGRDRISRYEFGRLLAELLGVDVALVRPCAQADVKMSAPRPADVSLDSSLAFSLGYHPLSLQEELARIL